MVNSRAGRRVGRGPLFLSSQYGDSGDENKWQSKTINGPVPTLPNSPTEGVLDRLFIWLDTSLVRQTAGELCGNVTLRCGKPPASALCNCRKTKRGNTSGRCSGSFSSAEVDPVLQRRRVRESLRLRILADATEQVVELVLKGLASSEDATRCTRGLRSHFGGSIFMSRQAAGSKAANRPRAE